MHFYFQMMDPLSFPYNQYPLQPQEHLNAPNIPIQMDKMVSNNVLFFFFLNTFS